jgi:DNA-directed RNA polymerase subunit K/omega
MIENHQNLFQSHSSTTSISSSIIPSNLIFHKINENKIELQNIISFKCPRHLCDTCYEFHGNVDLQDLCDCHYCPRAFHSNCIPPGSRFNSTCIVCPLHPQEVLPGDASLSQIGKFRAKYSQKSKQQQNKLRSYQKLGEENENEGNDQMDIVVDNNNNNNNNDKEEEEEEVSGYIQSFFEQIIIPDTLPDIQQLYDNHYRLPLIVKAQLDNIPATFKLINKNNWNNFPSEKIPPLIVPTEGCDCRNDSCGWDCYNRQSRIECCAMKCHIKSKDRDPAMGANMNAIVCAVSARYHNRNLDCGNRALQHQETAKVKVIQEGNMGFGLQAEEDISRGKLVIEYIGEILDETQMIQRLERQRILTPSDKEYYIMELDNGVYVDGKYEGNLSRFINHSCDPNCELQRWNVRGKIRIGIVAIKAIKKGEALSYDYQFDTQQEDVFKCYCQANNCRGTMAPRSRKRLIEKALNLMNFNVYDDSIRSTTNNSNTTTTTTTTTTSSTASHPASSSLSSSASSSSSSVIQSPTQKASNVTHTTANPIVTDTTTDGAAAANVSDTITAETATTGMQSPPAATMSMNTTTITTTTATTSISTNPNSHFAPVDDQKELRMQLLKLAKDKEKEGLNRESILGQELARSYTSKYLPGDKLQELKNGPMKAHFQLARLSKLFLVRNIRQGQCFTDRKILWEKRVDFINNWKQQQKQKKKPTTTTTATTTPAIAPKQSHAAGNNIHAASSFYFHCKQKHNRDQYNFLLNYDVNALVERHLQEEKEEEERENERQMRLQSQREKRQGQKKKKEFAGLLSEETKSEQQHQINTPSLSNPTIESQQEQQSKRGRGRKRKERDSGMEAKQESIENQEMEVDVEGELKVSKTRKQQVIITVSDIELMDVNNQKKEEIEEQQTSDSTGKATKSGRTVKTPKYLL